MEGRAHQRSCPSRVLQSCKVAFLACCVKALSPDALQQSKAILDKEGSYILGNVASKRSKIMGCILGT